MPTKTMIKVTDPHKAWTWAWRHKNEEMMFYILYVAQLAVSEGATEIDGFKITEEKEI